MFKKIIILFLCIIISINLTGCFDVDEIDDLVFIISIGIDKGTKENLKITVQYPTTKSTSQQGSSSSDEGELGILSVEAPSIFSAIDLLNSNITRRFSFTHLKLLVFSEEIAREGLNKYLNSIYMYREMRHGIPVLISKTSANDFVKKNQSIIGSDPSKTISFIPELSYSTGLYPAMILEDFGSYITSTYSEAVAMLVSTKDVNTNKDANSKEVIDFSAGNLPIESAVDRRILGTAIFHNDKLVGELNGDETRVFLIAADRFKGAFMDIPDPLDPNSYVSFDVRLQRPPKVTSKIVDNKVYINISIFIEPNINDIQSGINYLEVNKLPILESAFANYIKTTLDDVINKCQYKYNSDIFGFGDSVATHFLTIQEWEKFDWLNNFDNAIITTDVKVVIRRTGKMQKLKPIKGD